MASITKKVLPGISLVGIAVIAVGSFLLVGSTLAAPKTKPAPSASQVRKFVSAADFKSYLSKSAKKNSGSTSNFGAVRNLALPMMNAMEKSAAPQALGMDSVASGAVDRYSATNVQVAGIDEPDIVKTDGQNIFLSSDYWAPIIYSKPLMMLRPGGIAYPYPRYSGSVNVIKAVPPSDMQVSSTINTSGNLLLNGNVLMVFSGNTIKAYNVNDQNKELWNIKLSDRSSLIGARLYGGKLYLATQDNINYGRPCPYQPLTASNKAITIPCGSIYHPITPVPTDIIYTVSAFDGKTGAASGQVSFTGSSSYSILYMSQNAAYVTYLNPSDLVSFSYRFLSENKDLVPSDTLDRLSRLINYDISDGSKQSELYYIMNQWLSGLDSDAQLKLQNQLQDRLAKYYPAHLREFEKTNIVKTNLSDLKVAAVGSVPGRILNQYSLDEYQGNLRVAVTVGQSWVSIGNVSASVKSASDVYVLGPDMTNQGSVKDLGVGEQIYSARFIGDRGYVVTFKQTDPFYVLNLADPRNPKLAGELKIPGYSSYLEPIGNELVLGVGKEDAKVKVALYDVHDASNPTELSKFTLDEFWSEALNNPHAFLRDDKHNLFFIPGGQGGYVFSYAGNQLSLLKAVSGYNVKRALYIGDTLYIVSDTGVSAWDENNWNKLGELNLNEKATSTVPSTTITPLPDIPNSTVSPQY
jgi:uncharacterized secreted protein with C-terminal beta-propeller domain